MANPVPPHIQNAQNQLAAALQQAEGKPVDLLKAPWPEVEKGVIKLLGGPFKMEIPEHQFVALALAGALAARLDAEYGAFWFPNRDSMEGAALGFPEALIMLSPFGAVADALAAGKLEKLDTLQADIRRSLGQVRFGAAAGGQPQRMTALDYQRLFDPGFLQFVLLDPAKAKAAFEGKPDQLARDIRDALGRTHPPLPAETKAQLEGQLVGSLQRMEVGKSLADQAERAPRLVELMGHLFGCTDQSGAAPEEFWAQVVMPLLYIGAPAKFPPLDDEEKEAFKQGAEPMLLFTEVVPHASPAPEEGLLGAIDMSEVELPHPSLSRVGALRLIGIKPDRIKGLLDGFDPSKLEDTLKRFVAYCEQETGAKAPPSPQGEDMLKACAALLGDLKRMAGKGQLCVRRVTEAEAASEQALGLVRKALQGPRIILA